MTVDSSLDKHRVDFAHNYTNFRIKCPECFRVIKGKNHVRVFKNISGVWWHFKNEHGIISNTQFTTDDIKEALRWITKAQSWGIIS